MAWSSALPLLTVVLSAVVALVGGMWALVKANRVQMAEFVDVRFDALVKVMASEFDTVSARFDGMDTRLDTVDKRIDGVDRRIDEFRADFRTLTERVDRMVEGLPPLLAT